MRKATKNGENNSDKNTKCDVIKSCKLNVPSLIIMCSRFFCRSFCHTFNYFSFPLSACVNAVLLTIHAVHVVFWLMTFLWSAHNIISNALSTIPRLLFFSSLPLLLLSPLRIYDQTDIAFSKNLTSIPIKIWW